MAAGRAPIDSPSTRFRSWFPSEPQTSGPWACAATLPSEQGRHPDVPSHSLGPPRGSAGDQLPGLSTAVEAVPGVVGGSKSTVSRDFRKAPAAELQALQERGLSAQYVAAFLDAETFAEYEMVIALDVGIAGDKHFLHLVRPETENARISPRFCALWTGGPGAEGRTLGGAKGSGWRSAKC